MNSDEFSQFSLDLSKQILLGEATNPTIIEFLRRFSEIESQHPINNEEEEYEQDALRSDSEIEAYYDENEEKQKIQNYGENITQQRMNTLNLLREKYNEKPGPGKDISKPTRKDALTVHEMQKKKQKEMEEYRQKRKDLMTQKVDPQTLKQNQRAQNQISQRHGLKPFVDTTKSDKEKEKQKQKLKQQKKREFSEETKKINMSKALSKKPKTQKLVEEKPPPQYDPYLHDYQQKVDRELQAYQKLIASLQEDNEEPYYDSASLFAKLDLRLDAAQTGADYHMRFAILFQQLESAEEKLENLKNEL